MAPPVPWTTGAQLQLLMASCVLDIGAMAVCLPVLARHLASFGCSDFHQGLLLSLNALCACTTAPWLGRLSDSRGRVPLLRASSLVACAGYAATALAPPQFSWGRALLAVARVLPGLCRAQVPCAQAYISDVSDASSRGPNMGLLGLSFGLAFVVGPALGGFLASKFESLTAPLVAAAALCGLNACLLSFLPESHSRSTTTTSTSTSKAGPTEKPSALAILQLDSLFQRWYRSPGAETMENCESAAPSSEAKSNEDATVVDGRNRGAASRQASMTMRSLTPLSKQAIQHAACLRNLLLSKLAFNLAKGGYESLFTQHLRRRFGSNDSEVAWLLMLVGAVGMTTNSASQLLKKKMSTIPTQQPGSKEEEEETQEASVAKSAEPSTSAAAMLEQAHQPAPPPRSSRHSGGTTGHAKLLAMTLFHALALVEWGRAVSWHRFVGSVGIVSAASNAFSLFASSAFAAEAAAAAPQSVGELMGFSSSLDTVARVVAPLAGGLVLQSYGPLWLGLACALSSLVAAMPLLYLKPTSGRTAEPVRVGGTDKKFTAKGKQE